MANTNDQTYLEKVIEDMKNKPYRKNHSKIHDISNSFKAETLYIGTRKRNTKLLLRIYDKKKEQVGGP